MRLQKIAKDNKQQATKQRTKIKTTNYKQQTINNR